VDYILNTVKYKFLGFPCSTNGLLYSLEGDQQWLDYKVILLLYSFSQAAADIVQVLDTIQGWQVEVLQNQSAE